MAADSPMFEYRPALEEACEFLLASSASRFLLVGESLKTREGLPDGFAEVDECRYFPERQTQLPTGNYRFRLGGADAVMLVTVGPAPGPSERGGCTADGLSALENAARWLEHFWEQAEPIPAPPLRRSQRRGDPSRWTRGNRSIPEIL